MSNELTILIVEDEEIERKACEMMLKYGMPGIKQVISAENGLEALEKYRQFHPDIVLMDINLPGINGLETIRQMQKISSQSKFVILSAYNAFEYAQEAIRLNVVDFLIKPINPRDLGSVIQKLADDISRAQAEVHHKEIQDEKLASIRPLLENDCIYAVASLREDVSLTDLFGYLKADIMSGCVLLATGEASSIQFVNTVCKRLKIMSLECIGDMLNDKSVFIVLSKKEISKQNLSEILNYILTSVSDQIYIGVGKVTAPDDNLRRSYSQAMAAVQYAEKKEKRIVFYDDLKNSENSDSINFYAEASAIISHILEGDVWGVNALLDIFFTTEMLNQTKEERLFRAGWLYDYIATELVESGISPVLFETKKVKSFHEVNDLREFISSNLVSVAETQIELNASRTLQSVNMVVSIIHSQYMKNISLESVAKQMNCTPYYISRIFKKKMGTTFSEYLIHYRVNKAKTLLEMGEMSIKEIAYATGFNSQGYFAKIFKKYTGVSPSEYK